MDRRETSRYRIETGRGPTRENNKRKKERISIFHPVGGVWETAKQRTRQKRHTPEPVPNRPREDKVSSRKKI